MKATIEFDLPDERPEFKMFSNASDFAQDICAVDTMMRSQLKHGGQFETVEEVCQWVRNELCESLSHIY